MGLICTVLGHRRQHNKVWHDNLNFRAPCRRCGIPMVKDGLTERWRRFVDDDYDQQRLERGVRQGS
jgi:hypothetical protein